MMDAAGARVAVASALRAAAAELATGRARTENLAEYVPPHRRLLIPRPGSFVRRGEVWRLGVLLLGVPAQDGDEPALFATGAVTRAREPRHPNFTSVSGEERRELREAARRAGFGEHDTVNYDAPALPLDDTLGTVGPLVVRGDELLVSWNGTRSDASLAPFDRYLRERVELAVHPPEGA